MQQKNVMGKTMTVTASSPSTKPMMTPMALWNVPSFGMDGTLTAPALLDSQIATMVNPPSFQEQTTCAMDLPTTVTNPC